MHRFTLELAHSPQEPTKRNSLHQLLITKKTTGTINYARIESF